MLIYAAKHGTLPPVFSVDADGKPLHSWRVLILPYLEDPKCAELYDKIRLDEPWDSEYNRQYHSEMPEIFRCPGRDDLAEGDTAYSVFVGQDSVMGKSIAEIGDLERYLIVERAKPVCWMTPDVEIIDEAGVGKFHNRSFHHSTVSGVVKD